VSSRNMEVSQQEQNGICPNKREISRKNIMSYRNNINEVVDDDN
jgi:hypothetical protein